MSSKTAEIAPTQTAEEISCVNTMDSCRPKILTTSHAATTETKNTASQVRKIFAQALTTINAITFSPIVL